MAVKQNLKRRPPPSSDFVGSKIWRYNCFQDIFSLYGRLGLNTCNSNQVTAVKPNTNLLIPTLHRLTSLNFAFPSLQSVRVLHSGQLLTALCSSCSPVWSSASVRSSSQRQLLGTVSLTMFEARQHWMSSNSAWKRTCLYNHTTYRLGSVELSR